LVKRARTSGLKPGDARRASGAAAGAGPSSSAGNVAAGAARANTGSGARGAGDGSAKERELVQRCARDAQPREMRRAASASTAVTHAQRAHVAVAPLLCARSILRTKDYYELLGVARSASDDEIKKACAPGAVRSCSARARAPFRTLSSRV
jgi:hypothetical protein